ncbi:hypothetical protein CO693_09015 [Morganella morganii]|nr:hypothetical protein CO693_09015 [Morganella morganii]
MTTTLTLTDYDGLGVLVKINNINDLINIGESDLGTINSQTTGINISKNEFDNLIKNINAESYNELVVINYIIVGIFVKISDIELGYINDTHVTPPDIDYSSISNEELNKLNKEIERKSKVDMREITNLSNENNIKIFYLENKTLYCHTPATNDEFKPANLY